MLKGGNDSDIEPNDEPAGKEAAASEDEIDDHPRRVSCNTRCNTFESNLRYKVFFTRDKTTKLTPILSRYILFCFFGFVLKIMTYKSKTQSLAEFYNLHLKYRKVSHILAVREIHHRFQCQRNYKHYMVKLKLIA